MGKKLIKMMDYSLIIVVLLLFGIGLTALYSANGGIEGDTSEVTKQIVWFFVGVAAVAILIFIDYEWIGKLWIPLYVITILVLIAVLFTKPINGARSWFVIGGVNIQPGELAKITLIVGLGKLIEYFKQKNTLNQPTSILMIIAFVAVPFVLVAMQPDYGTAFVFLVIAAVMIFIAGIKVRYIISAIIFAAVAIPMAYSFILPQHAKDRLVVFLNPQIDPRGKGYHIIQSKLAVGSGQLWGMGLFNGNQTQLGILLMKTTDFIYAVISEEMGFIISTLVVILFVLLIGKSIYVGKTAKDLYGSLISVGVAGLFLAHFTENIGMTMGLMPITGIPLPFISYGGSAMLTNMIALALVLNVSARRQKIMFIE